MTWFSIRARDVWLFRDGKPFTAGDDNLARSMFPPTPLTVQGALRQKISESHGLSYRAYKRNKSDLANTVSAYIGRYEAQVEGVDTGAFEMRGPLIGFEDDNGVMMPLVPCPADLLKAEDTSNFMITQPDGSTINNDLAEYQLVGVQKDYENLPSYWMTGELFSRYLEGGQGLAARVASKPPRNHEESNENFDVYRYYVEEEADYQIFHSELVYNTENRFGVSTDSATSFRVEGQLYQVQFVRPTRNVCLLVDVDGGHDNVHVAGQMTMGGEQRQATNTKVDIPDFQNTSLQIENTFKVIFLTPAYFEDGWLPANGDWSRWFGSDVRLVGAALYRPLRIGGWNNARGTNGGARPMHNYVAPGSVYYFEGQTTQTLPKAVTQNPPNINDASQIGFGQVAYGTWS